MNFPCEFRLPHKLSPLVISFTKADGLSNRAGLAQPSDPLPAAKRTELMLEKNPATAMEDETVPYSSITCPPVYVLYLAPASDTSGYALFDASNPATGSFAVPLTAAR